MISNRLLFVDILKGISIMWVVLFHINDNDILPKFLTVSYRLPLFFIVSGIFFKQTSFVLFFKKRINYIIIPFVFFLFLSWILTVIKYEFIPIYFPSIKFFGIGDFQDYTLAVLDLVKLSNPKPAYPIDFNGPLWFLLSLFNVQIICFVLFKLLSKNIALLTSLLISIVGVYLDKHGINGFFLMCYSLQFVGYYAFGIVFGKFIVDVINTKEKKTLLFILLVLFMFILFVNINITNDFVSILIAYINSILFFILMLTGAKMIEPLLISSIFLFFGSNSLVVLAMHSFCISISKIIIKFFDFNNSSISLLSTSILYILVVLSLIPIVLFFNKRLPYLVGKKSLL